MTTVDNYQPCIDYECPFEEAVKENEKNKLEQRINIGGNTSEWVNKKMTVWMHTGHSIGEMLHAVKDFEAAASDISTPEDQKITQFKKCLGVQDRDPWDLVESSQDRRNAFTWEAAKKAWIANWVVDTTAKEIILYDWSSNKKYAKPAEENIPNHRARISMICNYIDMLPGNRGLLTSNEKKNLFYNSFSESWKKNYKLNGRNAEDDSIAQIEYYMEQQNKQADKQYKSRKQDPDKKKKDEEKKVTFKEGQGGNGGDSSCRIHGGHRCKKCIFNPQKNQA